MMWWRPRTRADSARAPEARPARRCYLLASRKLAVLTGQLPAGRPAAVQPGGDPPLGDAPQGLDHDGPAHLARAAGPLHEGDGHLDDGQAGPDGPQRQLDLEAVALRFPLIERDPPQR